MDLLDILIPAIATILGSSGLWAYMSAIKKRNEAHVTLMKGLAYSALVMQGRYYCNRGWMTPEEYSDYYNMLYLPYTELGGNGSAERMVRAVDNLPLSQKEIDDE